MLEDFFLEIRELLLCFVKALQQLRGQRDSLRREPVIKAFLALILGFALIFDQDVALLAVIRGGDLLQEVAPHITEKERTETDSTAAIVAIRCLAKRERRDASNLGLRELEPPLREHAESHSRGEFLVVENQRPHGLGRIGQGRG
jgi:hypothetical protein